MTAKVIAEIGCNHMGQLDLAKEMVMIAATVCKVDIVKFQKRHARELLSPQEYDRPHPNPDYAYGPTYGLHREALEFSAEQHAQLKATCEQFGVAYSTSVWDLTSTRQMVALQPSLLKVPSACNLNRELLTLLADTYGGEIHVSVGMTNHEEEERLVRFFEDKGRAKDLVLYSCTSGYPVKFEDICLLEITRLKEAFGSRVKAIGFSGHHLGIAADIAAMTLGAQYIERHFTLDRTAKGTDHAASLEPDGMRRLARDARNVGKALCAKSAEILPVEEVQRNKLKVGQIKW
ncbi:MAG: N-acetylneuraminate synthase family protein [Myxococcota bacterium]|nr:N-acetylneuraminate synthase family protein [Myxococcota bacterium]